MKRILRRNLVQTLLCGAAGVPQSKAAAGPFFSRRIDEMTSREVESYINDGGDLVLIPFGPVSGHGPFIPMGMHAHWANALSVLLAEKANGLVFPATFTCFAGATRTFRGTVSFTMEEQILVLKRIASTLHAAGFKRTVLVAGTNPEDVGGIIAARALFDETEVPYYYLQGSRILDQPEIKAMYAGYPGNFGETVIELASLRILGRERPIPVPNWTREAKPANNSDQPPEIAEDMRQMKRVGAVGWRYFEEKHHGGSGTAGMMFRGKSDIDLAVQVLHKCAELALPALQSFSHYQKWLADHPMEYIRAKDRLEEK
ncbi:MAG: creatininase family protein [Candidatus Solibacter usitatus]|nr:creatininase family protein [Candidatus Solibacter usitatus]